MPLILRIGSVVGVPIGKDQIMMGTVQGIKLGRLHISSTAVNHDVYGIVWVQVDGAWWPIEDICHYDPDYVELLESATI